MALEIIRDWWICKDCTMLECYGDASGMSDEQYAASTAGFDRLPCHISANFDSESNEGIREFSNCGCDVCGSRLAGSFHRFAQLGVVSLREPKVGSK